MSRNGATFVLQSRTVEFAVFKYRLILRSTSRKDEKKKRLWSKRNKSANKFLEQIKCAHTHTHAVADMYNAFDGVNRCAR